MANKIEFLVRTAGLGSNQPTMMFSIKEVADCIRDLLPKSIVYEIPNLDKVGVDVPSLSLYVYDNHISLFHGQSLLNPVRFKSLFDLQDWIVTNLL